VADPVYGDGKPLLVSSIKPRFKLAKKEEEEKPLLGRLALHASLLQIRDLNGVQLNLEALLPKDLRATLNQLRKAHR
jgi:23S rRNA pseudouridine955/2504/2580 synthase/23S rRNA pseudouridine1911/1915/1917 synthase